MPVRSVFAVGSCVLLAVVLKGSPVYAAPTSTAAWSVAPAAVGLFEGCYEHQVGPSVGAQVLASIGKGWTGLVDGNRVRGLSAIDGRWVYQLGGQLRYFWRGTFERGWFAATELRWMALTDGQFPTQGLAIGPQVGGKLAIGSGLTVELAVGGAIVGTTLEQTVSRNRIYSVSVQPLVRTLLGWSW